MSQIWGGGGGRGQGAHSHHMLIFTPWGLVSMSQLWQGGGDGDVIITLCQSSPYQFQCKSNVGGGRGAEPIATIC